MHKTFLKGIRYLIIFLGFLLTSFISYGGIDSTGISIPVATPNSILLWAQGSIDTAQSTNCAQFSPSASVGYTSGKVDGTLTLGPPCTATIPVCPPGFNPL